MNMDDKSISIIPHNEVRILVTKEDKTGENILAMSDFFGGYVQQQGCLGHGLLPH